jgi:hypothetical protein
MVENGGIAVESGGKEGWIFSPQNTLSAETFF